MNKKKKTYGTEEVGLKLTYTISCGDGTNCGWNY